MKAEGKTGREIAKFFGVSPPYICNRLKRLQPVKEPEIFAGLTGKQKRFVLAKVEGKTNVEAALSAFDCVSRDSAKALGHTLMKDPDIGRAIQEVMAEEGLTRRHIVKRLKWLVDHLDGNIVAKGIDITNRLTGDYAPEKRDIRSVNAHLRIYKTSFSGGNDDRGIEALQPETQPEGDL